MKLPVERQIAAIFYPKQTDMDAKPQLSVKMSEGEGYHSGPFEAAPTLPKWQNCPHDGKYPADVKGYQAQQASNRLGLEAHSAQWDGAVT